MVIYLKKKNTLKFPEVQVRVHFTILFPPLVLGTIKISTEHVQDIVTESVTSGNLIIVRKGIGQSTILHLYCIRQVGHLKA